VISRSVSHRIPGVTMFRAERPTKQEAKQPVEPLWSTHDVTAWGMARDDYVRVVSAQNVSRLLELDAWYRNELPAAVASRQPRFVTHAELVRATEWKMARGVWRQRNLVLVRSNDTEVVERCSRDALAAIPDPRIPITKLASLHGVGPATASAITSAASPETYPFFDEIVAAQVPDLGAVTFTLSFYTRYADALRTRANALGAPWTPTMVEQALWAHAGGKVGATRQRDSSHAKRAAACVSGSCFVYERAGTCESTLPLWLTFRDAGFRKGRHVTGDATRRLNEMKGKRRAGALTQPQVQREQRHQFQPFKNGTVPYFD